LYTDGPLHGLERSVWPWPTGSCFTGAGAAAPGENRAVRNSNFISIRFHLDFEINSDSVRNEFGSVLFEKNLGYCRYLQQILQRYCAVLSFLDGSDFYIQIRTEFRFSAHP